MIAEARTEIALEDGSRVKLLNLPVEASQVSANLVRESSGGEVIWTAAPGDFGPDEFVAVRFEEGVLIANTWSGYAVWLDLSSGREIRRVFTK